jgi:hypothetical protein
MQMLLHLPLTAISASPCHLDDRITKALTCSLASRCPVARIGPLQLRKRIGCISPVWPKFQREVTLAMKRVVTSHSQVRQEEGRMTPAGEVSRPKNMKSICQPVLAIGFRLILGLVGCVSALAEDFPSTAHRSCCYCELFVLVVFAATSVVGAQC